MKKGVLRFGPPKFPKLATCADPKSGHSKGSVLAAHLVFSAALAVCGLAKAFQGFVPTCTLMNDVWPEVRVVMEQVHFSNPAGACNYRIIPMGMGRDQWLQQASAACNSVVGLWQKCF